MMMINDDLMMINDDLMMINDDECSRSVLILFTMIWI